MMRSLRFLLPALLLFASAQTWAQCNANFTATSSGNVASFTVAAPPAPGIQHIWAFGDGTYSYTNGGNISHAYASPGTYYVTHTVHDSLYQHCADSAHTAVTLSFTQNCHAEFTIAADSQHVGHYTFTYQGSAVSDSVHSYSWQVDGQTINHDHSCTVTLPPGSHNICLTVTGANGCSNTVCHIVNVPNPCDIHASFTYSAAANNPHEIHFMPNPNSNIYTYHWYFGDGGTSTDIQPTHVFSHSGFFPVTIEVTRAGTTCHDSTYQQVYVQGFPSDSCTTSYSYFADSLHPDHVTFVGHSNQAITSQVWTIAPTASIHDTVSVRTTGNFTYTFPAPGTYIVCLVQYHNTGCVRTYCDSVVVRAPGGRMAAADAIPSYPNPATSQVDLRLQLDVAARISIKIYNSFGTVVYSAQRSANAGGNDITIPVQQLSRGQYYIDIEYNGTHKKSRFQKL